MPVMRMRVSLPSDAGSPVFHRRMFAEFCRLETATGGPDPHVRMAARLALDYGDPAWLAGCYTASYVVSTGLAVAGRWSREDALKDRGEVKDWIAENWRWLPIRKERRVNGVGPAKMAEILTGYARWLDSGGLESLRESPFGEAFAKLDPPHYGRYFRLKLYETLRLISEGMSWPELASMDCAVPRGGKYSRKGLALLFPGHDYESGKIDDLEEADRLVGGLRDELASRGVRVSWFAIEALLCNYRQAVDGGQYPGRALDSEFGHCLTVCQRFPSVKPRLLECRRELFPQECLGEFGDRWRGRRVELGKALMDYGYLWSDLRFCYHCTGGELARPAVRESCQCE